jgi:hypothetical protein
MPQIRVTRKFATDLHLKVLPEPVRKASPLDDWVIDLLCISRRKVAMVTQAQTFFTFFIPYTDVAGAKNVVAGLQGKLERWLYDFGFERYIEELNRVFAEPVVYCKTQDRRMLGHINDFKRCTVCHLDWYETSFDQSSQRLMDNINEMPVNLFSVGSIFPRDRMKAALSNWRPIAEPR